MVIYLIQHLQLGSSKSNNADSPPEKKKHVGLPKQQENEPKLIMSVVIPVLCSYGQKGEAV